MNIRPMTPEFREESIFDPALGSQNRPQGPKPTDLRPCEVAVRRPFKKQMVRPLARIARSPTHRVARTPSAMELQW